MTPIGESVAASVALLCTRSLFQLSVVISSVVSVATPRLHQSPFAHCVRRENVIQKHWYDIHISIHWPYAMASSSRVRIQNVGKCSLGIWQGHTRSCVLIESSIVHGKIVKRQRVPGLARLQIL